MVFPGRDTTASAARVQAVARLPVVQLLAGWSLRSVRVEEGRVIGVELDDVETRAHAPVRDEIAAGGTRVAGVPSMRSSAIDKGGPA